MHIQAASALFDLIDRELWLVTASAGARRSGLIATFFSQASIVPDLPRVLVGIAKQHFTGQLIETSRAFALHLLGQENLALIWRFGLETGRKRDKFEGHKTHIGVTGAPVVSNTIGHLECRVEDKLDTGDRMLYVGEVIHAELSRREPPFTFRQLMKISSTDKMHLMTERLKEDIAADTLAIRAWREQKRKGH